jgi:prophage antirepressor-like protein
MNKIQLFKNEQFGEIRTVVINQEIWFVAKDIANILEYRDAPMLTRRLDADEKGTQKVSTLGGEQELTIINESGLYNAILGSNKPEAKVFKKWVTSEVLPSIRKTGGYIVTKLDDTPEEILARAVLVANDTINRLAEQKRIAEQERDEAIRTKSMISDKKTATAMNTASQAIKKINRLEIEIDRSKEYRTIKGMELKHKGYKFSWRLLKAESIKQNLAVIKVFDVNYGEVSSYHKDVWENVYPNFF